MLAASLSVISFDTSFSVYEFIDRSRAASGSFFFFSVFFYLFLGETQVLSSN